MKSQIKKLTTLEHFNHFKRRLGLTELPHRCYESQFQNLQTAFDELLAKIEQSRLEENKNIDETIEQLLGLISQYINENISSSKSLPNVYSFFGAKETPTNIPANQKELLEKFLNNSTSIFEDFPKFNDMKADLYCEYFDATKKWRTIAAVSGFIYLLVGFAVIFLAILACPEVVITLPFAPILLPGLILFGGFVLGSAASLFECLNATSSNYSYKSDVTYNDRKPRPFVYQFVDYANEKVDSSEILHNRLHWASYLCNLLIEEEKFDALLDTLKNSNQALPVDSSIAPV